MYAKGLPFAQVGGFIFACVWGGPVPECVGGPGLVLRGPGDMGGLPHGQVWSGAWSKRAPIVWGRGRGVGILGKIPEGPAAVKGPQAGCRKRGAYSAPLCRPPFYLCGPGPEWGPQP